MLAAQQQEQRIEQLGETAKKDFPLLGTLMNNKPIVYLDSAATSQKPQQVLDAIQRYYEEYNANVHRGIYALSEKATTAYEHARYIIARFINAMPEEIIFTRGTTESLNLLAYTHVKQLRQGQNIVLTQMEHHSNLVPWQQLAKEKGIEVRFIRITQEGRLDMEHARQCIDHNTKIVSITHVSNVLGTINPVKEIAALAHGRGASGAMVVVDAAQSIAHTPINVKELGCDFLAFSSHKMFGPTGVGILYGRKELLDQMPPFQYGGDMIREVRFEGTTFAELPHKFEAGTPNIAGVIGLAKAVEYLKSTGMEKIQAYEHELTEYALARLQEIEGLTIYGPRTSEQRSGAISFAVQAIHSHAMAQLLDREGICVRGGHHCCMPLMSVLQVSGTTRISLSLYNTRDDIDKLIAAIEAAKQVFYR